MSTHAVVIVELDEQKMRAINNVIGASFHRMPLDFVKKETYHGYELPYAVKDVRKVMLCTTKVKERDKYVAIYVHWDGDRVGNVLKKKIKTYDDAISLISFGFMSVIEEKGILPYMYVCGRHYECESWNTLKPKTYRTLKGCIKSFTCPYAYVFTRENKWMSADIDSKTKQVVLKNC